MREIEDIRNAIKSTFSEMIYDFNNEHLPHLELAWGRSFADEFTYESQKTVEITKQFTRPLNNCFVRHIQRKLPEFLEDTTEGHDYVYKNIIIEDKNSFSGSKQWVGNGFNKADWHILKKFSVDDTGCIIKAFVCMVDISECNGSWTDKKLTTNRSSLSLRKDDIDKVITIIGSLGISSSPTAKYITPIMEDLR